MAYIRSDYQEKIDKIPNVSFNKEQKQIAKKILDVVPEKELDAVFGLITQRVKTGFVFDEAPEVNHNAVALIKENKELGINLDLVGKLEHKLIIGENYDALKNLCATYIDKNGKGLIDVIYIDPPYNTEATKAEGNDYKEEVEASKFVYRDKFTRDGWLNMMNERLKLAKRLLSDTGVIFISIDDSEQAYLKVLCDEIFGEENFVANLVWQDKYTTTNDKLGISSQTDFILCYAKNIQQIKINKLPLRDEYIKEAYKNPDQDPNGPYMTVQMYKKKNPYSFEVIAPNGKKWTMPWNFTKESFAQLQKDGKIFWGADGNACPRKKVYLKDAQGINPVNLLLGKDVGFSGDGGNEIEKLFGNRNIFSYPKNTRLMKHLLKIASQKGSMILDFFAGSGTTGQAVMELNEEDSGQRKFILVTNNENQIGEKITRERLYRVINGKGSQDEKIDWAYTKEKQYLNNNSVRVFEIETSELTLNDLEKAEELKDKARLEFKKLNENYLSNNDFDIYNELSALNPQKKNKDD